MRYERTRQGEADKLITADSLAGEGSRTSRVRSVVGLTPELELRGGQGAALGAVGGRPPRLLQRIVMWPRSETSVDWRGYGGSCPSSNERMAEAT
jgi:hypothetical protein